MQILKELWDDNRIVMYFCTRGLNSLSGILILDSEF